MERIDRNGGRGWRTEPNPETVFIFDINGGVHEVICDRQAGDPAPRPEAPRAEVAASVIQRWLAGIAVALVGLGLLAEPGLAMQRPAPDAVLDAG